ncbi:PREDICTED: leucine-rich repeat transmembrane neuronal protein 2-like isoform X2 [Branchiostoma belcheri]|uniref:Leucine-rich repeat transmembrane neuronal protein 2-like isoform X2 n=1 Tax=Branchiostoma belcheri TaxID=7741 RepID=A0A6P4Y7S9_BRABE|nr:PREDICTED: leucine-rich repeat transmembrane neuronal protein 2-like isoform X2 [Branchiostoma belcheri]
MSNKVRRMLVLLLIILKEAGPTAACSSSCSSVCGCRGRGLTSVPQDLPTDITQLDLGLNDLTTLNQSDFSRYRSLTTLDLGFNQISMIHNKTFHNLTDLTRLDLNNNQLTNLTAGMFVGLGHLRYLWIQNNQLTWLPAHTFVGLGNLWRLSLSSNQLTHLSASTFVGLGSLEVLYLSHNNISTITADTLGNLRQLQTLKLSHNNINTFPVEALLSLNISALSELTLDYNQFKTLTVMAYDILTSISKVNINNNPWQCDCRMVDFRQRMNGSYQFENKTRCAGPASLTGQLLLYVNPEDLICETTPVYSTSSTKHMVDSTDPPLASTVTLTLTESNTDPADGGTVLTVPLLATLGAILGLSIICIIGFAVGCMYKRRQRDPTPQQGFSNTNSTSSDHDQIRQQTFTTNAEVNTQSGTPHSDTEDSQHIYNLPTDEDPDTAEYDTIGEVNQSESKYRVVSPSQTSQPGSGQIQHLGSFNDGYEVPSPFLYPGEGPQSHKYVNSHVTADAINAAFGSHHMVYENDNEIESAKEDLQSHKYVNSHMAAAAKDAAAGPKVMVHVYENDLENEDEIESTNKHLKSHKYVNSHVAAAAIKDAAAGPQLMVYENDDEVESAKEDPQSHKYVNSQVTADAINAAFGSHHMVYENDNEIESANKIKEDLQSHKYVNSHVAAAAKDAAAGPQDVMYSYEND